MTFALVSALFVLGCGFAREADALPALRGLTPAGADAASASQRPRHAAPIRSRRFRAEFAIERERQGRWSRKEIRLHGPAFRIEGIRRRSGQDAGSRGAIGVDRGPWRIVLGGYRVRTLAGFASGASLSRIVERSWRTGRSLAASTSQTAPVGAALGWQRGAVDGCLAAGISGSEGRDAWGWALLLGAQRRSLRWELAASGSEVSDRLRLDGAIGFQDRRGGVVVGLAETGRWRAVRLGLRRRVGPHQVAVVWTRPGGRSDQRPNVLEAPGSAWTLRYRLGGFELLHRCRQGSAGEIRTSQLTIRGRQDRFAWRARMRRRADPDRPASAMGFRVESRPQSFWHWQLDLRLEAAADSRLASLFGLRVARPIGRSASIEVRSVVADRGGFWVARRQGLGGIRSIWLRSGERLLILRLILDRWSVFTLERDQDHARQLEFGIACRWAFTSEEGL